jgi:hypothetical protein
LRAFLVEHDRLTQTSTVTAFDDRDRAIRTLNQRESERAPHVEVVLLFAESEAAIRKTHSRYFHSLSDLARRPLSA